VSTPEPAPDLEHALAAMSWRFEPGRFVLLGFQGPPTPADLEALEPPAQLVREAGETTLLLSAGRLSEVLARHPASRVQEGLLWIRFEAAMGWEVVGFLARVTGALAAAGVPLGAVCGYSRDHLFVAEAHEDTVRRVLDELFPRA